MIKLCVKDCIIDGLAFICGSKYKIEFNSVVNKLVIYHLHGYTYINKNILDKYFL